MHIDACTCSYFVSDPYCLLHYGPYFTLHACARGRVIKFVILSFDYLQIFVLATFMTSGVATHGHTRARARATVGCARVGCAGPGNQPHAQVKGLVCVPVQCCAHE